MRLGLISSQPHTLNSRGLKSLLIFSHMHAVHVKFFAFQATPVDRTIQNGHHVLKPVILQKNFVENKLIGPFSCTYLYSGRKVNRCDLTDSFYLGLIGEISMK